MMVRWYIMASLKIGKSGGREYLSIVSGYWDPINKRSRTKTIESLGYLDSLKEQYDDPIAHFQKVVDELNKNLVKEELFVKLNKSSQLSDESNNLKNLGYFALSAIYHELGLDLLFRNRARSFKVDYSINDIMKLLVFSRILDPNSKKHTYENKDRYFETTDFTLENVYRCLSHVASLKEVVEEHLYKKSKKLYDRKSEVVYYDVTNYYFEIDDEDKLRKKGVSKEHRNSPIVQMGLFMDSQGIPISYRLFEGNTHDSKTLIPMASSIYKDLGIKRTIVVADKGLNTADNIAYNIVSKNGYVYSQTVRGADKELKNYVLNDKNYKTIDDGFKIKSRIVPKEIAVTNKDNKRTKVTIEQKQVAIYSLKYALKAKKDRQLIVDKAQQLVNNPSQYNKATSYGAAKYVKNLVYDKDTGEILTSKQKPIFDTEKLNEDEKYDGYYLIVTNELDKSDEEILKIYKGLWQIEESFRITKSDLKARPVYLSRQERINAHFLTCFIALYIIRILQQRLNNKHSVAKIAESLNLTTYTFLEQNIYVGNYCDEITKDLKEIMGIDLTYKYMTLGEIKNIAAQTKKGSIRKDLDH